MYCVKHTLLGAENSQTHKCGVFVIPHLPGEEQGKDVPRFLQYGPRTDTVKSPVKERQPKPSSGTASLLGISIFLGCFCVISQHLVGHSVIEHSGEELV